MEFALNYSPQAVDALTNGAISIDRFKCPPWKDLTRDALAVKPVYIHFSIRTGALHQVDFADVERWMLQTNTPKVNVHLYLRTEDLPGIESQPETVVRERVMAQFIADLETLSAHFGAENVVAENVPFGRRSNDKSALPACIEPEVIRHVLESAGVGLLLDTAHATITALSLDRDPMDYILDLPLERTGEVHFTGVREHNGGLEDHLAFTEADFATAEAALKAVIEQGGRPWVVTCEYGGITPMFDWRSEYDVIVHDIPRLTRMVEQFNIKTP